MAAKRVFGWMITKDKRIKSRSLLRRLYIVHRGDEDKIIAAFRGKNGGVGSVILFLTVSVLLLQFAVAAIQLWKNLKRRRPPVEPLPDEGFELASGEAYALDDEELEALRLSERE